MKISDISIELVENNNLFLTIPAESEDEFRELVELFQTLTRLSTDGHPVDGAIPAATINQKTRALEIEIPVEVPQEPPAITKALNNQRVN